MPDERDEFADPGNAVTTMGHVADLYLDAISHLECRALVCGMRLTPA